jgi:glycerol-3-phosphate dehydrogenase
MCIRMSDVVIIGAGIAGAGIARDLALRGIDEH